MSTMDATGAAVRYEFAEAQAYTMRQLNQNTAGVMDEINRSGEPALITKHGRLVAMITPLAGAKVESVVLSKRADRLLAGLTGDEEIRTTSSAEVAAQLGLELPPGFKG